jgi:hypothetical protein
MKVTVNIECTPVEARQFFGLPDLQPMQTAVLAAVERRMLAEAEKFSPEGFMRAWFGDGLQGADWFRDALGGFFKSAAGAAGGASGESPAPGKKT